MTHRHRHSDVGIGLALLIALALAVAVALSLVLTPAQATQPPVIPAKLAKEARYLAKHGGVLSTKHGDATPRMKSLVVDLILARFRPYGPAVQRLALCVARGESGFNPGAISSTSDYGIYQINRPSWERTYDWKRILDPVYNVGVGWAMSQRGTSWGPWVVYTRGYCS